MPASIFAQGPVNRTAPQVVAGDVGDVTFMTTLTLQNPLGANCQAQVLLHRGAGQPRPTNLLVNNQTLPNPFPQTIPPMISFVSRSPPRAIYSWGRQPSQTFADSFRLRPATICSRTRVQPLAFPRPDREGPGKSSAMTLMAPPIGSIYSKRHPSISIRKAWMGPATYPGWRWWEIPTHPRPQAATFANKYSMPRVKWCVRKFAPLSTETTRPSASMRFFTGASRSQWRYLGILDYGASIGSDKRGNPGI